MYVSWALKEMGIRHALDRSMTDLGEGDYESLSSTHTFGVELSVMAWLTFEACVARKTGWQSVLVISNREHTDLMYNTGFVTS